MKTPNIIAAVSLFFSIIALILLYGSNRKVSSLQRQLGQLSVTINFSLQSLDSGNVAYDSVIFKADTGYFYKQGKFLGKSYTETNRSGFLSNEINYFRKEFEKSKKQ